MGKKVIVAAGIIFSLILCMGTFQAAVAAEDALYLYSEAFGASTGFALYDVQIVVGMAADSCMNNVYTDDEVRNIVAEQRNMLKLVQEYCGRLLKVAKPADMESLNEITACADKLAVTIGALEAYLGNRSDTNAEAFQAARKVSYASLDKLLGLEKNSP